ncbi:MAG TPA: hypothetical protein VKZ53_11015 [Candidatus Angelobacter sp.]|nr:hypothetical protein [Candidatus Angelobacter sp.]
MNSKVKPILYIALFGAAIFVGAKLIPPYFESYQFQDDLDEIARRNSYTHRDDDEVKGIVIRSGESRDILLKEDQVTISRTPDGLGITVHYRVHVDLMVREMDLDFTTNSTNKRI